ncbi:MAG: folate-binding protein YgfZ [Vicinamibacterales bacterium]
MLPPPTGYLAARQGAAILDRRERGRLLLSGSERASYLQGMLTNDILALQPGQGCYSCYLTAQGRMISDMWVFELGDVLLMTLPSSTRETVLARLDQFIFSEDVQLGDVTDTFGSIAVLGPDAPRAVAALIHPVMAERIADLPEGGNFRVTVSGEPAIVLRVGDLGVPAYELLVPVVDFDRAWAALLATGAEPLSEAAAEALRIEGGVPRFHRDMDEETIPLEANLETRAISQHKGCYVGQEVIIRVLHRGRGRVAKRLVGFVLDHGSTADPATGRTVHAGAREIGRVTSATLSPMLHVPIALGYVQRDFVAPGTAVSIDGTSATVAALPFVGTSGRQRGAEPPTSS